MKLSEWAKRWNIPWEAMMELQQLFGVATYGLPPKDLSEAAVQALIRMEASRKGARLWRNNVGAAYMQDGGFLRYGLANDSSTLNSRIKSADLIGIRPVKITESMVGNVIGQFVSREVKNSNWRYAGTEREVAQLRWAELIMSLGGDASFANGEGTL